MFSISALATPELAKAYTEAIAYHGMNPSENSKILSQNVVSVLAGQPPFYPSSDFIVAVARWLNGDELCDMLGLPQTSFLSKVLVFAQCVFCCYIAYAGRIFPSFDKRRIPLVKKMVYAIIVDGKSGLGGATNFEFQFVPQFATKTEAGKVDMEKTWGKMKGTAERRSIQILLICLVILGFMGLVGIWLFGRFLRLVGPLVFSLTSVNPANSSPTAVLG